MFLIHGMKTFLNMALINCKVNLYRAHRCSTNTYKWLEYLFQSLGKHFIRLQHIKILEAEQKSNGKLA